MLNFIGCCDYLGATVLVPFIFYCETKTLYMWSVLYLLHWTNNKIFLLAIILPKWVCVIPCSITVVRIKRGFFVQLNKRLLQFLTYWPWSKAFRVIVYTLINFIRKWPMSNGCYSFFAFYNFLLRRICLRIQIQIYLSNSETERKKSE